MTTKKDNLNSRINTLGIGQELSVGIPQEGFQDPTGEYPKRDYNYGTSINKSARGEKINELYIGGGDYGLSLDIQPQRTSEYPFNQVSETISGHVVEYDDTPGGERILIKHRTGAGVEMRSDGSVIISSTNNKIEITGGDQTVIVEGHGNLIYKGNLNLVVTGDYNVDVGGNYNVNVAGNREFGIGINDTTIVNGNAHYVTKGSRSTKTIGINTDIYLDDAFEVVGKNKQTTVEGNVDLLSGDTIFTSAEEKFAVTTKVSSIIGAKNVSMWGNKGSIGGKEVNFTGSVYMGNEGPQPFASGAAFYGSFHGQATEAMFSRTSWTAEKSKYAEFSDQANAAVMANTAAMGGASSISSTNIPSGGAPEVVWDQEILSPLGPPPVPPLVAAAATTGTYGIKSVVVDEGDALKQKILLRDDYNGLFEKIPTTQEIRSSFRNEANKNSIAANLVVEGRLSYDYANPIPPKIGRSVSKEPRPRFGTTPIGNATENRGKRFTPK